MPLLKEERDTLILCYDMKIISHDEFLLQFDADRPEAPNLPYDSYPEFNLDEMNGDKWLAECQFKKSWYSFATRQLFCRFIDDTVRPISRPERHKRTLHNGHKRAHPLKFQSLVLPSGLVANMPELSAMTEMSPEIVAWHEIVGENTGNKCFFLSP